MTRLAQLLHYTSLSQALFSKPLPPDRANAAFKGECDPENSQLNLPRWTPCLFFFIFIFFIFRLFPFTLFHFVHSLLSLFRNYSFCWSVALCLSLLFLFVILVVVQPPPLPSLLLLQLVCGWVLSGLLRHIAGMCGTQGGLGGRLTVVLLRLLL